MYGFILKLVRMDYKREYANVTDREVCMYWVLVIFMLNGEVSMVTGYNEQQCKERIEVVKEWGWNATCELGGEM